MPTKTPAARLVRNPALDRSRSYDPALGLSLAGLAEVRAEIARWPGYAPTPVIALPGLARALGIGAVLHKDEGARFGLKSFKALGGAYAVLTVLRDAAAARGLALPPTEALLAGALPAALSDVTVACATDGNHGRSVAWGAQMFGIRCVIYLHENVSAGREREIARYGAEIRRVPGSYDASVRQCARDAAANGWVLVADTSAGLADATIPNRVMQGYGLIVAELSAQISQPPTHVFVPAAVGGLAAALVATWWEMAGADRPVIVAVEAMQADCIARSLSARRMVAVEGDVDSFMACLAAGEVSPAAWPILAGGLDAAIAVSDPAAAEAMRLLARGGGGDPRVVAGESGAAATAALVAAARDPALRAALDLGPASRVVTIGSEGATDPETYARTVGRSAAEVAAMEA